MIRQCIRSFFNDQMNTKTLNVYIVRSFVNEKAHPRQ